MYFKDNIESYLEALLAISQYQTSLLSSLAKYVNLFLNSIFFISEDTEHKMILAGFSCLWQTCTSLVSTNTVINQQC